MSRRVRACMHVPASRLVTLLVRTWCRCSDTHDALLRLQVAFTLFQALHRKFVSLKAHEFSSLPCQVDFAASSRRAPCLLELVRRPGRTTRREIRRETYYQLYKLDWTPRVHIISRRGQGELFLGRQVRRPSTHTVIATDRAVHAVRELSFDVVFFP
jgi:hypothetical protein